MLHHQKALNSAISVIQTCCSILIYIYIYIYAIVAQGQLLLIDVSGRQQAYTVEDGMIAAVDNFIHQHY